MSLEAVKEQVKNSLTPSGTIFSHGPVHRNTSAVKRYHW